MSSAMETMILPGILPEKPSRAQLIARHRESMRLCWPEWQGPAVAEGVASPCAWKNGTILILDILDLWPPVHALR